jgi:hypothetical protein
MKRWLEDLLAIAWPPYRRRLENHRGWCLAFGAGMHLMNRPDYDANDIEAARLLGRKMRELNG